MEVENEFITDCSNLNTSQKSNSLWSYFDKQNNSIAQCKICTQKYQGPSAVFYRHLQHEHQICICRNAKKNSRAKKPRLDENNYQNEEQEFDELIRDNALVLPHKRQQKEPRENGTNSDEIDPYDELNTINDYAVDDVAANEVADSNNSGNKQDNENLQKKLTKRTMGTLEEERILAEIEYFREKADFYRKQKHLVAMKAKKFKTHLKVTL